jgi:hypothetical protein
MNAANAPGALVQRDERADAPLAHDDRRHDRRPQRAVRVRALEPRLDAQAVVAHRARQGRQLVAGVVVVGAEAVERQHLLGVGQRDGARAGEHPQLRGGARRAGDRQAAPQVRQQRRGGVHRALHRRAGWVLDPRRAHQAAPRGQRCRERQPHQHTQYDVHPQRPRIESSDAE